MLLLPLQVIAGWEKAIAGMKKGGKRIMIIPPQFAYGDNVMGSIPRKVSAWALACLPRAPPNRTQVRQWACAAAPLRPAAGSGARA